jgi:PilZ domain
MKRIYLELKYGKDNVIRGYILDLSRGGMAIACSKSINYKKIVEIEVKQNKLVFFRGKIISIVCRQSKTYGYRLGIKFIPMIMKKGKLAEFIRGAEQRKEFRLNLLCA